MVTSPELAIQDVTFHLNPGDFSSPYCGDGTSTASPEITGRIAKFLARPPPNRLSPYTEQSLLAPGSFYNARLMRHFVETQAPILDLDDVHDSFARIVPQNATKCQPLLRAMIAVSAMTLSVAGHTSPPAPEDDSDILDETCSAIGGDADDDLFLVTVLLQLLDNIRHTVIYSSATMDSSYLSTCDVSQLIIGGIASTGLRRAAASALLRQELYFAVLHQRPIGQSLGYLDIEQGDHDSLDDSAWAHRMVLHLSNVVQYCFGVERDRATYMRLVQYSEEWFLSKPASFEPVLVQEQSDGDVFPDIYLLSDAVALGLQYYYLARLLLISCDPALPQFGAQRFSTRRSITNMLLNDLKVVCGIAISIGETSPSHLAACMSVALAGEVCTRRSEQLAILDILTQTESTYGWPTTTVQRDLREAWDFPDNADV
ncbi:hypothetical protein BX600DRAFT_461227 [Xylariales sp. PMI_506]|nr:hypothetical protein BX600DRAFT_461227 [Xylariales sp. PMI_506]